MKQLFDTQMSNTDLIAANIEIKDALFKSQLYFLKIIKACGSLGQVEKICHLAAETCMKFQDNLQFNEKVFGRLQQLIRQSRNYFLLYLLDILIKNNRSVLKMARGSIEELFKIVWDQVWQQYKNQSKLECLKAMARTWKIIYPTDKIYDQIQAWVQTNYNSNLVLQKKNEQLFNQVYEKYKPFQLILPKLQTEISKSDSQKKSVHKLDCVGYFQLKEFHNT